MSPTDQAPPFVHHASQVVTPLREALSQLFGSKSSREREVRDFFAGLNPTLQSRLGRAIETDNSLVSLYYMPGPASLRRVLRAARRAKVGLDMLAQCEKVLADYEQFLEAEDVGRDRLHAMLSSFIPEARDAVIRTTGQSIFRAMSNLVGHFSEAQVLVMILTPGSREGRCDVTTIRGHRGWRRLRLDSWLFLHGFGGGSQAEEFIITDLRGTPIAELGGVPLIEPYCSNPLPHFEIHRGYDTGLRYQLAATDVGSNSQCTFYTGEVIKDAEWRYRTDERSFALESVIINTPSKHLLFDVLVHKDIWQHVTPVLETYRVVPYGPVTEPGYAARQQDRLDLNVVLRHLPSGLAAIDSTIVPDYRNLINYSLAQAKQDPADFAGYRCAATYPLYGTQYAMRFDLPAPP